MEFIKQELNINFMGKRKITFMISAAVIAVSILSLVVKGGPNYGIDFVGGTLVQIKFTEPVTVKEIRGVLGEIDLGRKCVIQRFGDEADNEYLFRLEKSESSNEGVTKQIEGTLKASMGDEALEIRRSEVVGPKVGKELREKGVKSILYAMIFILIYITWRFEFKFALGAIFALIHDVIITIGIFSITGKEISLPIVAALLTIVGYSLNDTIIVFDRIRELARRVRRGGYSTIVNRALNITLNRTLLTSLTTLIVVVTLFILGGGVIHDFAFAMIIGVLVGTYSSIFVASPVLLAWETLMSRYGKG
ncbi:protein translocase subunit SecF [Thermodesulfobacteriota bacterium]